jgi:GT2 family glycosyltransferase
VTERPITVVVPNWNGRDVLEPCLEALRDQAGVELDTVCVDNGSTDGSLDLLRDRYPEVRVIELGANRGFAVATNAGIRAARGDLVALLNNDTAPAPDWLHELRECLGRHPRAAAATSKLLARDEPARIDDAGDLLTNYFRAYERGRGELDQGQFEQEEEVFGACGAASLWRREALDDVGLLAEDFFAYYEDVDLSLRVRLAGYECWYAPRAVVLHARGATSRTNRDDFVHYHAVRNRWAVVIRGIPGPLLFRRAHLLVLGELLSVARAVRERGVLRLLRAYAGVVRALPRLLEERAAIQQRCRLDWRELARLLTPGHPGIDRVRVRSTTRRD